MNHERSRSRDKSLPRWENNRIARHQDRVKQIECFRSSSASQLLSDSHQSNSSRQLWRVERQRFERSLFCQGLFWGSIIGLTSVVSALFGVALTEIDTVERLVTRIIGVNRQLRQPTPAHLTDIDVLLVEFQPNIDRTHQLSSSAVGRSETIFLLRFDPNLNSVRIINIPLDTKVEIPDLGTGTVADAYQLGGIDLLTQAINRLMNSSVVDGYIRTTPVILESSFADDRITVNQCDRYSKKCSDEHHIVRQKNNFESISQYLKVSDNLDFKTVIAEIEPMVDTNMSVLEIMSLANFVRELEPDSISADLLPGYIPGKSIYTID